LKKSGGYPCVSGEAVSKVEATFHWNPRKSVQKDSHEL
jgi:hypothetical protein